MRYYSLQSVFQYTWEQVATAFWYRYPNKYTKHVNSEDVVGRELVGDRLVTKRLFTKSFLRWTVYVVEESIIDRDQQTITTYTRNITMQDTGVMDEKCEISVNPNNNRQMQCFRQSWAAMKLRVMPDWLAIRYSERSAKHSSDGFLCVLMSMYGPSKKEAMKTLVKDKFSELTDKTKERSEKVKGKIHHISDKTKEKSAAMKEKMNVIKDKTREKSEVVKEKIKNAKDTANNVKSSASNFVDKKIQVEAAGKQGNK